MGLYRAMKLTVQKIISIIYTVLAALAVAGVADTVIFRGFLIGEPPFAGMIIKIGYTILIVLYLAWVVVQAIESRKRIRPMVPDIILSALIVGLVFTLRISGSIVSFRIVYSLTASFLRTTGITAYLSQYRLNPARILLLSFVAVILSGTLLLMLPAATSDHEGTRLIDALFTATSATCVTGLIVQDTGTYFSGFGQSVILLLIQFGGLGIMTLSTLFALILGRRLALKQEEQMSDILEQSGPREMYRLVMLIVRVTLFFELAGAAILYLRWIPGMGAAEALKTSVFHSVSAFCNAGFSLYSTSLTAWSGDFVINSVIGLLIVFGGLGFVVINDLIKNMRHYNPFTIRWERLSVHSRVVIITSTTLLVIGTLTIFFFEFDNTLLPLGTIGKLMASVFQSITLRTAGFNTIDIAGVRDVTLFIMILFMFIGASPASTGGGIKTTTFAVLILSVRSLLLSRNNVEIFNRTIPHQVVYRAIAITLFSLSFLAIFVILMLTTQAGRFLDILFEAVSAMGTVGLSTGVTGTLDPAGKILVTLLMYIGRVGPLTVALALGEVRKVNVEYPTTRISVG